MVHTVQTEVAEVDVGMIGTVEWTCPLNLWLANKRRVKAWRMAQVFQGQVWEQGTSFLPTSHCLGFTKEFQ